MTYIVKVDNISLPFSDHQWHLTGTGGDAPLQFWDCPRDIARKLQASKLGREVTLTLGPLKIERVIFLGFAPSDNDQEVRLVFTNVLWYMTRAWFAMDVNVRRRVGDTRLVGEGVVQARQVVQDVQYAGWSIENGVAYSWQTLVKRVMDAATLQKNGRPKIEWTLDTGSFNIEAKTVQETITDSAMPVGLSRAIAAVPGRGLYVDLKGVIHVYDRAPGAERSVVEKLPDELLGAGHLELLNLAAYRPKSYRVLFTNEFDVRCTRALTGQGSQVDDDQPFLENVLPVPDIQLAIPAVGRRPARTVGQGSWITFEEAYQAWGAPENNQLVRSRLTDTIVRSGFCGDLLTANYVFGSSADGDPTWSMRIDAVMRHYRTTWRVNPKFWARVRSALAVTNAVWDEETATRARSPVFCNYAKQPLRRPLVVQNTALAMNVDTSYASSGLIRDCKASGARLVIEDAEQGILKAVWNLADFKDAASLVPSLVIDLPNLDPSVTALLYAATWPTRALVSEDQFRFATILSLIPAGPNDTRRFYEVEVKIADAVESLGLRGTGGLAEPRGPDMELRSDLSTARYPWSDDQDVRDRILAGFGSLNPDTSVSATDATLTPRSLKPINLELELRPIAKAVAAAHLVNWVDHYEGSRGVPINGKFVPIGSIQVVTHRVLEDMAVTVLDAIRPGLPLDPLDFLPTSVRKRIGKEVQP